VHLPASSSRAAQGQQQRQYYQSQHLCMLNPLLLHLWCRREGSTLQQDCVSTSSETQFSQGPLVYKLHNCSLSPVP
jgi:hypothetical protein